MQLLVRLPLFTSASVSTPLKPEVSQSPLHLLFVLASPLLIASRTALSQGKKRVELFWKHCVILQRITQTHTRLIF